MTIHLHVYTSVSIKLYHVIFISFQTTTGQAHDTMGSAHQRDSGDVGADDITGHAHQRDSGDMDPDDTTQEHAHQRDGGDIGGQELEGKYKVYTCICM